MGKEIESEKGLVMKEEKMIHYNSPEAAQLKDLKLWVSANGRVHSDENSARYDGCTHKNCECGELVEKMYTLCEKCRGKRDIQIYWEKPLVEWDGESPLYDDFSEEYFFYGEGEILDHYEDNNLKIEDLRLLICEPQLLHQIDPSDIFEELIPEDGELPDEIISIFEELNKKLMVYKKPISWIPGKGRVSLDDHNERRIEEKAW